MSLVQPTVKWFNTVDSLKKKFYWKKKKPRIKLTTLQKPKTQGACQHYYLASQLLNGLTVIIHG